jgi:hypothetical protein
MAYSPEQRAAAIETVIAGLRKGTPLTVLCDADGMPGVSTVYLWMEGDEELSGAIARAREQGFDQIALDALAIADETSNDTRKGADGNQAPNSEWITRSRLRVETRLKLLAKWDPKRYGEATMLKHADAEGGKLDLADRMARAEANVLARMNGGEG